MNVTSEKNKVSFQPIKRVYANIKHVHCTKKVSLQHPQLHINKNNSSDLLQLRGRMHNNFKNFPKFMHNFIKDNLKEARCLISVA